MVKKTVFIAFPIEEERMRDMFTGQRVHPRTPFEFIDMSVKEAYESDWKTKVQTRIRRSDGVIALMSKHSATSVGQKWEIECAKAEGKSIIGIHLYKEDRTTIPGIRIVPWTWEGVAEFIDSL